jgi:hypothetical protein
MPELLRGSHVAVPSNRIRNGLLFWQLSQVPKGDLQEITSNSSALIASSCLCLGDQVFQPTLFV